MQSQNLKPHSRGTNQKQEEDADIIPAHTEIQKQECGIPPLQSQQFHAKDFNMLPQQTFPMPFHNAYEVSTSRELPQFPESYYDPKLERDFTLFLEQAVPGYGNSIPTIAPMSSIPPDQFHWIGHDNLDIRQHPQKQFSGVPNNFEFSAADKFLLNMDFGLSKF
ncbi:uncharacterized protein LOC111295337 [Durio zibethinus]|uniref:Uncharacterized protein LOC111295337 n=1 Tax=Durio zibethinus TaxID=66656 RepID=A0A6P5YVD7_DURZI|nr:uncharacterized protein LOC111295337 [Durio zibethinus]XP_022744529.1 uncharacterized protein LOC111295337 [Durio zibethinus]